MVSGRRVVRLVEGTPGSDPPPEQDGGADGSSSLQSLVSQQRQQQGALFREATARLRRTAADLQQLRALRETLQVRRRPPWAPELAGLERLLTSESAWREYQRRYLLAAPLVQLPPPEEVDVRLLTARLSGADTPMLPTPGRTCAQGFYPPAGRVQLGYNEERLRCLVPGARLPNTVIIRLLWSTRTLLDVEYYRAMENRRTRRRQHWSFFEWSDSDGEEEEGVKSLDSAQQMVRLESVATRRRNRRKISMVEHVHLENWLHIAESGADAGAAPDSEDELIARARQRRLSRRGQLRSDIDGAPATEEDAYMPAFGRFTCGTQTADKKKRRKKSPGQAGGRARRSGRRRGGDGQEGAPGEEGLSNIPSEYYDEYSDDDEYSENSDESAGEGERDGVEQTGTHCRRPGDREPGAEEVAHTDDGSTAGRHVQYEYASPSAQTGDGRTGASGLAPRSPGVGSSSPAPGGSPARWSGQAGRPEDQRRPSQPYRQRGSVSPGPVQRGRTSVVPGGDKTLLTTARVRPDMDASVDSVASGRSPPRRQALRTPHLFELKDYVCEDSKVPGKDAQGKEVKHLGMKHGKPCRRGKQRQSENDTDVGYLPKSKWSPSKIPGIFYDNESEESEEALDEQSSETSAARRQRSASAGSKPRSPDVSGPLRQLAVNYITNLMQHDWARELLHGTTGENSDPWEVAERLVKRLPKLSFEIQQNILREVRTIHETFPAPSSLRLLSNGILTSLYTAMDDIATLTMAMDTLVLIADQMDVVLANILAVLALGRLDVRDCIQALLEKLGLVDPHHLVLTEALSWAPHGKHRNMDACLKEIGRKALGFVSNWMQAFEAHTKLIAEEVNKRKLDAIVKYNIIKILKNYEPLTIEETGEGFTVNLREPSSTSRLKNPEVIEVLNYFVEMTDDEDDLHPSQRRASARTAGSQHEVSDPLEWRRNNKDILVPPSPSPLVQGNRPLAAVVLRPTALVTHWHGLAGLAPGPWPSVTVGLRLRIADKYYRGAPLPGVLPEIR